MRISLRNGYVVTLSWAFLLAMPAFARESTDVVVMKNGDRLTGEIKGLNAGVLYMSMQYILGTSSVDWSKVSHLESKQLFLVKDEDGSVYTGTLSTTDTPEGRPIELAVAEASESKVIESTRIVQMDMTSTRFYQRFNGDFNTGIIYSKGNQSTQYNLSSEIAYPRERWSAGATFDSTLSASTGASASTRNQVGVDALRLLRWNQWFYEGVGAYLQSSEQGIVHQSTYGGGIGRYLTNTNHARVSLLGGFVGQNTQYERSVVSQSLASGLIAANLQFFRFNKTHGSIDAVLLPVISASGRVKFNMNGTYYIKITGNLSWNVSVYGNWDSHPPAGLSGSDYGSSSGLSWTFGNK